MKQSCNIIKDLLILYEDDACSKESKDAVEEHIKDCEECNQYYQRMKSTDDMLSEEIKEAVSPEEKVMKHGLKKIRRRWIISLVVALLIIPLASVGILCYNEETNSDMAFSNLDEIYRCTKYLKYIENKEFEKAADMVDFIKTRDYSLSDEVNNMTQEEYEEYMRTRYIQKLEEYDALGIYIDNIFFDSAYRNSKNDKWTICMAFDENYPDGSKKRLVVSLKSNTMSQTAMGHPDDGTGVERDDYIDEILHLYSVDDLLGYQEYPVSFELKEGEKAIIHWNTKLADKLQINNIGLFNITYGTGTSFKFGFYEQDTMETSVPGKYHIWGFQSGVEGMYLTPEDIEIEIVKY